MAFLGRPQPDYGSFEKRMEIDFDVNVTINADRHCLCKFERSIARVATEQQMPPVLWVGVYRLHSQAGEQCRLIQINAEAVQLQQNSQL
jgi:hypothetical protein